METNKIVIYMLFIVFLYCNGHNINANEISNSNKSGKITVEVLGLESSNGVVRFSLHKSKTFTKINLKKEEKAECFYQTSRKINNGYCKWISDLIPYGEYVVIVHNDENNNDEMDRWLFVLPSEKLGVSNYDEKVSSYLEEKDFEKAKIKLNTNESMLIKIKVFYPGL